MICTCSYENYSSNKYKIYFIGDIFKNSEKYYYKLEPTESYDKKLVSDEYNKYYIEKYYKDVLKNLNPEKIYNELDNSILLSDLDYNFLSNRHIVAEWFKIYLNIKVPEIIVNDFNIKEVERLCYIRIYLEDIIKKNIDMRGFNSIRALYLFEKSEKLKCEAINIENMYLKDCDKYKSDDMLISDINKCKKLIL